MLATCRDTAGDPWRTSMAALARLPGVQVLRVAPLGEPAVATILQAAGVTTAPELARFVHARSEGNPLYVTTLARVLATQPGAAADPDAVARIAAGSAEVSHLVASLLRDLDQDARALLGAASVLGAAFDSGLATAVAGTSQDAAGALSAAETRGLVTRQPDRPGSWWFTHGLVRDGIYASLGGDQRIALHAAAAAALEPLARHAPNGAVKSPRTCCRRHRTSPHSGGRPGGRPCRRRQRRRPWRSRTRLGT
jgi:predicted ATPase